MLSRRIEQLDSQESVSAILLRRYLYQSKMEITSDKRRIMCGFGELLWGKCLLVEVFQ